MNGARMLKAAAALVALGYCSLLVYQGGVAFNQVQETNARVQVPDVPIETVTKTTIEESSYKNITLDDIFISVKTTKNNHDSRLPLILKTWFQFAKQQTWFFTDDDNEQLQRQTSGHIINTNCSASHARKHLCCKMSVEYDHYFESSKKWFCHFDDDNYVNIPRLLNVLQKSDYRDDWYLGKNSIYRPIMIRLQTNQGVSTFRFMFGTGGAGFCISRSLALKMYPLTSGGNFISACEKIRMPDDVTMGYIIEILLMKKLTVVPEFHSHLEQLKLLPAETFKDQISFSYGPQPAKGLRNVMSVPGFDTSYDPTRFLSLHCFLFPDFEFCPR